MIELPIDRGGIRTWVICESGVRWQTAARRFAAELMPPPLVASVLAADPGEAKSLLAANRPAVVLWEVQRKDFIATCDHVAQISLAAPQVLQLVAIPDGFSVAGTVALTELRAVAVLRHPEQLPTLASMIRGYFARPVEAID